MYDAAQVHNWTADTKREAIAQLTGSHHDSPDWESHSSRPHPEFSESLLIFSTLFYVEDSTSTLGSQTAVLTVVHQLGS